MRFIAALMTAIALLCAVPVYAVDSCRAVFGPSRTVQDIIDNGKLMDRLISTNDAFWVNVADQIANLRPGEMKELTFTSDRRYLESTIIHNARTGNVELLVFKFRLGNLKYGENPKNLSLEFSRMIATFAHGLQLLKAKGVNVNNVRIKADNVVNQNLISSLESLGFHQSQFKLFMKKLINKTTAASLVVTVSSLHFFGYTEAAIGGNALFMASWLGSKIAVQEEGQTLFLDIKVPSR